MIRYSKIQGGERERDVHPPLPTYFRNLQMETLKGRNNYKLN
jgi:hypothetical protein